VASLETLGYDVYINGIITFDGKNHLLNARGVDAAWKSP
jgi:hypothetical protein